jgi:hypothetical protein
LGDLAKFFAESAAHGISADWAIRALMIGAFSTQEQIAFG